MDYSILKILIVLQILTLRIRKIYGSNIIGCGGFVKTDLIGFAYHKLSAQLMFSDGTLNYVTDILPNGAYSIPIYDFGYYIIKIMGPEGWDIEPVDGYIININSQDSCSDDYNFHFTGFTIFGKVSTANIDYGPSGIFIYLMNKSQIVSQTITTDGGNFTISKVFPGKYYLQFKYDMIDDKNMQLNNTSYSLEVKNENLYIQNSFIIYGYPVFGDVKFYEEPVKEVEFFLFSSTISTENFNYSRYKCLKFIENFLNVDGYNPICKTSSNSLGEFTFDLLPGGTYLIVPRLQTEVLIYDLFPSTYAFEIKSSSIDLRSIFKVIGFTVFGQVVTFNGNPISKAEVHIDDRLSTHTNSVGYFSIKGVDKGNYEINVIATGYMFDRKRINFNPNNPNLGIFYPEKISICGSLVFGKKLIGKEIDESFFRRKILLINASNGNILDKTYTKPQDSSNKIGLVESVICSFCFYSQPGVFIVKPIMDSSAGVFSFAPSKIKVTLDSDPVSVRFSPFRGNISGFVKCIERCKAGEFEITLHLKEENIEIVQLTQHISISNDLINQGNFFFKDIIPGSYKIELISTNPHVSLSNNRWCWSRISVSVDVVDSNLERIVFEQIGFSLPIYSSHNLQINYFLFDESLLNKSLNISKGVFQVCLPKSGKYKIQVKSCYKLENNSYVIDSNTICGMDFDFQNPLCYLKIKVIEYNVRAVVKIMKNMLSQDMQNDVEGIININSSSTTKKIMWKDNIGYLDFWIKPEIVVNISINSSIYLIKPKTLSIQLSKDISDCLVEIGQFELESGTFINGNVSPAIKEVTVEIRQNVSSVDEDYIEHIVGSCETNEDGNFHFGPLNSSFKYDLKLSKPGFKIVNNLISENTYHFIAYKLAELIVEVIDNFTGKPISGILLSIIGNDIRRNELTKENGQFIFLGLTPGIYYLRAMMKELEFFPKGAVEVIINEGSTEKILIKAVRTSFSLHGKVISLNGEPESGVIIEAESVKNISNSDKSQCNQNMVRNEYATTDETGIFRIRGLQPGCDYKLSLKNININEDSTIIRSYPNNLNIKMLERDIYNFKIHALRDINIREISAMVLTTKEVEQTSLHLLVFPSDNPDNIISAHKFGNEGLYFQMSLPQIHKKMEYVVRLQSSLNPNVYSNISAQETTLIIDDEEIRSFYKHFEFNFCPVKKLFGESDVNMTLSSTLMLPLLVLIIALSFFKMELFEYFANKILKLLKYCFHRTFKNSNIASSTGGTMRSSNLDAMEIIELNNAIAKPKSVAPVTLKKSLFWQRTKKIQ